MKQGLYNLCRTPYYLAYIAKHGEVVAKRIESVKKNKRSFTVKNLNLTCILPDDKKTGIPPLHIKSGRLVVYDIGSAVPMKLVSRAEEGIEWMDEETRARYVVEPKQFALTPLDSSELHEFLEAEVVSDILSDNAKEIPMWLVFLIVAGLLIIAIIAAVYMVTHTGDTSTVAPVVTPVPTMYIST